MASITKGASVHVFGIDTGTFTDAVVTAINFNDTFNNTAEIINEVGNVIEERMDDVHTTGTVTLRFESSYAPVAMGGQFTYDSVTYYLTDRTLTQTNGDYREWSFNFKTSEYITLS
tara:strand:- start:81 stop:428 length:348 start_codon:yes stop_codon:yes gene_type:complete